MSFSFAGSSACADAEPKGSDAPVLRNLSFVVEPGQTVAIVGRTGSGKTSLVRLVNRIFDACEGSVLVDGVDVPANGASRASARRWPRSSRTSSVSRAR